MAQVASEQPHMDLVRELVARGASVDIQVGLTSRLVFILGFLGWAAASQLAKSLCPCHVIGWCIVSIVPSPFA